MVSKYLCETERNLPSSLGQAENARAALLPDEVVTLFGQRPAMKNAHERYTNVATSYLSQLLESFGSAVILTTSRWDDTDNPFWKGRAA